ncbi:conjugal transfer protein TraW [Escherichia coli]|nr:conjugal transfer protein TraW [Escherichia coli]
MPLRSGVIPQQSAGPLPCPVSDARRNTAAGCLTPSVRLAADIRDNEGRVFARQGEVMNPLQYVPFNQTLYFINGDDPAQVAWMKRQTPPTLESKIILVQGSIPEMQKSLDSRVYFDQNGVLCQRLGIDQVPARVSAVPGDRFLKVEFIPAEEGRK